MEDVVLEQVSLTVVKMTTVLGSERSGDQVVNVVGCDADSPASVRLFRKQLSAA